ncbi:hypothetical protein E0L36_09540 [Streptomyces sp. AJS327]|uniref:hypothetical protein n=1 Tax=Streptomyces sp. AJS327 TaxID=2545265 RepID=UPI0015DF2DD0|nr:hypothetical protein [Streptomyces sp. AJS327]MBA0051126.1 hypothetical protein [Streptomyces sp. AJS327]
MFDLSSADLLDAFTRELGLCKLRAGEHAVVLSEPGSRGDHVAAAFGAARAHGAHVIAATVPGGRPAAPSGAGRGTAPEPAAMLDDAAARALLTAADLVVDLTREGVLHSPAQREILHSGTRILYVHEPPGVLLRNLPEEADKARAQEGARLLARSSVMRVASAAGTDLTVSLARSHPGFQCGFTDDPGRWDHWPSTMVLCWPEVSEGRIVLAEGDIVLPFQTYVRQPVTLEIADGHIREVTGGAGAALLSAFFDESGDRWARSLSHMGWGLMRGADWFASATYGRGDLMGMDARAFAGNFLWSTGPHPYLHRETDAHLDIAMRGCTVTVDGVRVVTDGQLAGG